MTNRRTLFDIQLLEPRRLLDKEARRLLRSRIGADVEHAFATVSRCSDGLSAIQTGPVPVSNYPRYAIFPICAIYATVFS